MLILIDNGHGHNTPGKRSPDGKFLEYAYTREIATRIVADLTDRGYNAQLLVPEPEDIPLSERVRRINAACLSHQSSPAPHQSSPARPGISPSGHPNVILISIHVNAAGNGSQWHNATGWSCYTCKGQTTSDRIAECFYEAAIKNFPGRRIRTDYSDNDPDWEENFYILRHTHCPAVLIENFFMDNKKDLAYLLSQEGRRAIVETIIDGIERCVLTLVYLSFK